MKFLVTGGWFDSSGEGFLAEVDLASGRSRELLRWTPPPHLRVPAKGFAGGCVGGDGNLYIAAHAAVIRVDPQRWQITGVLHHPCFNDLHHVSAHRNRLYVSNTGLGALDVFTLDGCFLGSHSLLPAWVNHRRIAGEDPPDWPATLSPGWDGTSTTSWQTAGRSDSYHDDAQSRRALPFHRLKVRDHLHPNHACVTERQSLVTCLYDGSVRDLRDWSVVYQEAGLFPHDGVLRDGHFWLTSIDGRVLALDASDGKVSGEVVTRRSLFELGHWGWCRGLAVTDDLFCVGLTEVRRGRLPKHHWSERPPEGSETSVLAVERESGRLAARVDLTDRERHAKIYSLILWEDAWAE